jgi:hypothetical protein
VLGLSPGSPSSTPRTEYLPVGDHLRSWRLSSIAIHVGRGSAVSDLQDSGAEAFP